MQEKKAGMAALGGLARRLYGAGRTGALAPPQEKEAHRAMGKNPLGGHRLWQHIKSRGRENGRGNRATKEKRGRFNAKYHIVKTNTT